MGGDTIESTDAAIADGSGRDSIVGGGGLAEVDPGVALTAPIVGSSECTAVGGTGVGSRAVSDGSMTSRTSRGRLSDSGPSLAGGGVTGRFVEVRGLLLLTDDDFGGALDVVLASGLSLPTDVSDGFSLTDRFVWTACPSAFFRSEGFFGDGMTGILQESPTVGKYVSREITA